MSVRISNPLKNLANQIVNHNLTSFTVPASHGWAEVEIKWVGFQFEGEFKVFAFNDPYSEQKNYCQRTVIIRSFKMRYMVKTFNMHSFNLERWRE